ncbi:MAG: hypothetical protein ACEQSB_07645 [Undibacterium sp.]
MKSEREYEIDELEAKLRKLNAMSNEQYDIKKLEGRVCELERGGWLRRMFSLDPGGVYRY